MRFQYLSGFTLIKPAIAFVGIWLLFFLYPRTIFCLDSAMIDKSETVQHLVSHLEVLTEKIGERSIQLPDNIKKTQAYIESFYESIDVSFKRQNYRYHDLEMTNIVAEIAFGDRPLQRYVLGAHYDSVAGTVGADDNASAVAVQLETARGLKKLTKIFSADVSVCLISFALEEPPAYGTRFMGSRVYARHAKTNRENIDGMICLEMVGYTCRRPGCQEYPFPLMLMDYPETGDFIGIVANFKSRGLARSLANTFSRRPGLPVVKLTVPFSGWILPSVRLSDHASFWDKGFKAVMVTDSAFYRNPHYHLRSDQMDTLDYPFMAELVGGLIDFFLTGFK